MKYSVFLLSMLAAAVGFSFSHSNEIEERKDFAPIFEAFGYAGSILLFEPGADCYYAYNAERAKQRFSPASTYKIFNTMVALDSKVIPDPEYVIEWDGKERFYDKWNQDLNLREAFRYSALWYYQEMARRLGKEKMQGYLNREGFGNRQIGGDVDQFWVDNSLQVSQKEWIEYLRRLYDEKLQFSQRAQRIVKEFMIIDKTDTYTLRGKTGWGRVDELNIGWLVGYVEQNGKVIFYATNIEKEGDVGQNFRQDRMLITKAILKACGWL